MRKLRYQVVCSLDGFIAGPSGEYDWIPDDDSIDLVAFFTQFDTFLLGRRTFEGMSAEGPNPLAGQRVYVVSTTLDPAKHPDVTVISTGLVDVVQALKAEEGKDIWLFGGGALFRSLMDAGLVDTVELAIAPVLLGGGIPVIGPGQRSPQLMLVSSRTFASGIVWSDYEVQR
jgi:dihydrofolate reductase